MMPVHSGKGILGVCGGGLNAELEEILALQWHHHSQQESCLLADWQLLHGIYIVDWAQYLTSWALLSDIKSYVACITTEANLQVLGFTVTIQELM